MVRYYNDSINYRLRDKRRIAGWVEAIAEAEGYTAGDINYIFCSSEVHRKEDKYLKLLEQFLIQNSKFKIQNQD